MNARKQYLKEPESEYQRVKEKGRGALLDEAEKRTGLNRKYLIRVLNHPVEIGRRKPKRRGTTYICRDGDGVDRGMGHFRAAVRTEVGVDSRPGVEAAAGSGRVAL